MRHRDESRPYQDYSDYNNENREGQHNTYNRGGQYGNRYNQSRGPYHKHEQRWDEENYFHTGPQKHGAQDRYTSGNTFQNYGSQSHTYGHPHQAHHAGQEHHYGNDPHSVYRSPNALNYGDNYSGQTSWRGNAGGSAYGSRDYPSVNENPYTEAPGSRSRYKDTDYRYGSGQHNWYLEGRYSHENPENEGHHRHHHHHPEHQGFFDRMGNKISHAWHTLTGQEEEDDYHYNQKHNDRSYRRHRHHEQERNFNRGYESGPGWADEHTAVDPYKHHSNADARRSYDNRHRNSW